MLDVENLGSCASDHTPFDQTACSMMEQVKLKKPKIYGSGYINSDINDWRNAGGTVHYCRKEPWA